MDAGVAINTLFLILGVYLLYSGFTRVKQRAKEVMQEKKEELIAKIVDREIRRRSDVTQEDWSGPDAGVLEDLWRQELTSYLQDLPFEVLEPLRVYPDSGLPAIGGSLFTQLEPIIQKKVKLLFNPAPPEPEPKRKVRFAPEEL